MQYVVYEDADAFRDAVYPHLASHEAMNCVFLGILAGLGASQGDAPYMAAVREGSRVVLPVLCTPPHNLVLGFAPLAEDASKEAAETAAQHAGARFPGLLAPRVVGRHFVDAWGRLTGGTARLAMAQRIYRLRRVVPVGGVDGAPRPADAGDRELTAAWYRAFLREAVPDDPDPASAGERAAARIPLVPGRAGLFLWVVDGRPVSLAGFSGPTPTGMRIGPVYTPPAERGHGYASALVAALSQHLLDEGRQQVFLFTDLANPTSNHIYQAIGYEPVGDIDEYRLS